MGACFVVLAVFEISSAATNARQPRPMPTEMRPLYEAGQRMGWGNEMKIHGNSKDIRGL